MYSADQTATNVTTDKPVIKKLTATEEVKLLNKIWADNKGKYTLLYKQIKGLQTSSAADANSQIASLKKKMKDIEKKIEDVNPATKDGQKTKSDIFYAMADITYY